MKDTAMNTSTPKINASASAADSTNAAQTHASDADSVVPRNPRAVPLPVEDNASVPGGQNADAQHSSTKHLTPLREAATTAATPTSGRMTASAIPDATSHYGVGYKKPPEETRFKKGQSGNPKGRPKGSQNLRTIFLAESDTKVSITENGKTRAASKREIVMKTVINKAAKGDAKAAAIFLKLDERFNPPPVIEALENASRRHQLAEEDRQIMEYLGLLDEAPAVPHEPPTEDQPS